jgi:hypothetical protein
MSLSPRRFLSLYGSAGRRGTPAFWADRFLVFALAVCAGACRSGTAAGVVKPGSTVPFATNISGNVPAFGIARHILSIPRAGRMSVGLRWTDSTTDLDLYLAAPSCVQLYPKRSCGIVASSVTASALRESVSRRVRAAENYSIFIDNLDAAGAHPYTISIEIQ